MVNQRLLPPTFPRFTKIKERTEALNFFEGLIPRIKLACKVVNCTNYHSALVSVLSLFSFNTVILISTRVWANRISLWTSVKTQHHVCCHAAFCSVCTFRAQI